MIAMIVAIMFDAMTTNFGSHDQNISMLHKLSHDLKE